jgi:NIMA-interacting peptidyl-prolyl cis-trans isomerase 1
MGASLTTTGSGFFGRGDMQKEFEDAAFKLQPGDISDVVNTASGLHLIQRSVIPLVAANFSHSRNSRLE